MFSDTKSVKLCDAAVSQIGSVDLLGTDPSNSKRLTRGNNANILICMFSPSRRYQLLSSVRSVITAATTDICTFIRLIFNTSSSFSDIDHMCCEVRSIDVLPLRCQGLRLISDPAH
ncbi:uncharacterized protein V6R79_015839 [Siganus canaliculatus]